MQIKVVIAENKKNDLKIIKSAIERLSNYKILFLAESGRELILKLNQSKDLPDLILMDMEMPKCDGLLATIILKRLYNNLKIVGISSHTYNNVINHFMAEGGHSFLSKFIVMKDSAISINTYKDSKIFEKALNIIAELNKTYFDILCHYKNEDYKKINSTKIIIETRFNDFPKEYITLLQLNAAGFTRLQCAEILNVSHSTIKKYYYNLFRCFNAKNNLDLVNVATSNGIVKYVTLYQNYYV